MNAPQIIYLICAIITIVTIGLAMVVSENPFGAKAKMHAGNAVFGLVIASALYYWGGFFDVFEWPQITYWIIQIIYLGYAIDKHGQTVRINYPRSLAVTAIHVGLLYYGGFFK
jgi:hypothetical protein